MDTQLKDTIIELWHISRTALATEEYGHTRGSRIQYVVRTLKSQYPDLVSHFQFSKHILFAVEDVLN